MKTKIFILLCLFIGIGLTQISAQETRSAQYKTELGYYTPVYCGDEMVDYLEGVVEFHVIDHYKNGNWRWEIAQAKGEATGLYGEVFQLTETDKLWLPVKGLLVWHFNLKGNRGNHYIGALTYSYFTGKMVAEKTVCH